MYTIPIARLAERIKMLSAWLSGRLERIRLVRRARDAALGELAHERAVLNTDIESVKTDSDTWSKSLQRAQDMVTLLEARADALALCGQDLSVREQTARERWRVELRVVQDGQTRRKRTELASLESRLEKRVAERAARHPEALDIQYGKGLRENYGTCQSTCPHGDACNEPKVLNPPASVPAPVSAPAPALVASSFSADPPEVGNIDLDALEPRQA